MRYKPKSIAALHIALGGLPDKMRVEVDPGIQPSPKTVGELRKMTAWPENLAITTPQGRDPNSAVKVSKANVATRSALVDLAAKHRLALMSGSRDTAAVGCLVSLSANF